MKKLILPVTLVAAAVLLGACTRNTYVLVTPPRSATKPSAVSKPAPVRKAPASVATNMGDGFEAVRKPTTYSNP